jgi:hypothetical protein
MLCVLKSRKTGNFRSDPPQRLLKELLSFKCHVWRMTIGKALEPRLLFIAIAVISLWGSHSALVGANCPCILRPFTPVRQDKAAHNLRGIFLVYGQGGVQIWCSQQSPSDFAGFPT